MQRTPPHDTIEAQRVSAKWWHDGCGQGCTHYCVQISEMTCRSQPDIDFCYRGSSRKNASPDCYVYMSVPTLGVLRSKVVHFYFYVVCNTQQGPSFGIVPFSVMKSTHGSLFKARRRENGSRRACIDDTGGAEKLKLESKAPSEPVHGSG